MLRLVSTGTVEERIVQRAEKKLYLDKMVNRDGDNAGGGGGDRCAVSRTLFVH